MRTFVVAWLAMGLTACPLYLPNPDPDPELPPGVDAAEAACAKFEELDCRDIEGRGLWDPTPGGVPCVEVFRNAEREGVALHPACIAEIKTCDDRHACTDKD